MRSNLPSEPRPEDVTAIVDSREQNSLDLSPLRTVTGTLTTGDYSVVGLEAIVAIERKSESDLLGCISTDRARFEREVQRLMAYQVRALVIESTWAELEAGDILLALVRLMHAMAAIACALTSDDGSTRS